MPPGDKVPAAAPRPVDISIVIPSYRRPDGLARAIASVLAQEGVADAATREIVVVDNDPECSAEPIVASLAPNAAVPIRYISEPRRGISHARNTGVASAAGRYLAFVDDDLQVEPGWLAALLATLRETGADAAVGPTYPSYPPGADVHPYCAEVYVRDLQAPSGTPLGDWSIASSIFVKERYFSDPAPFDPQLGLTGGEDTVLLRQKTLERRRLVWCAEAIAHETIPADRLDPNYLVRRVFRGGQTTTYVCTAVRPREGGRAVRHMIGGLVQFLTWGAVALVQRLAGRDSLSARGRAASGLGKVLWHPSLHLRLYR